MALSSVVRRGQDVPGRPHQVALADVDCQSGNVLSLMTHPIKSSGTAAPQEVAAPREEFRDPTESWRSRLHTAL